jgi:hypothetical protein
MRASLHNKRAKHRKSRGYQVMPRKEPKLSSRVPYARLILVAITWLVFGQTLGHEFVNFDDHVYVYDNPLITKGITPEGIIGAFTHGHARNWHPLTTISHMLDCQLYGLKAGGHHFTNVLLHMIAVILLFLVLRQMTDAFWRSAFVAAVFAIHPTLLAQRGGAGAMDQLPLMWRINNVFATYVAYIWEMFWPVRLAVFYPHPNNQLPSWQIGLAIAFLAAVSSAALLLRKKRPYILTGWFWYLGMLVPVIGFVQVGEQARADRYTYLPEIGLYVLIVWAIANLTVPQSRERACRTFVAIAAPMTIAVLMWGAFIQTSHWKNSETLWTHALAVTSGNDVAHNNLGFLFLRRGELDTAISHFQTALNIRSTNAEAHYKPGLDSGDLCRRYNSQWRQSSRSRRGSSATFERQKPEFLSNSRGLIRGEQPVS